MTRLFALTAAAGLALGATALGQAPGRKEAAASPVPAASQLADALTRQLGERVHVKTVVGRSVTVGAVTLIPILAVDISFCGAGLLPPSGAQASGPKAAPLQPPPAGADGFFMGGEARPLGFVVVTGQGTRFLSLTPASAK